MGMMINRRRVCGGKSLPYDSEIEYLQNTGNAYINTGILNTYNIRVETGFSIIEIKKIWVYGARVGFGNSSNALFIEQNSTIEWRYGKSTKSGGISVGDFVASNLENANIMTIDGDASLSINANVNSFVTSLPIYIFAMNDNSLFADSLGRVNIKYFKMYDGTTLVRDYIPVRVGNVGYMYDKVSGQLFGNSGTGNFILGPDV